MDDVLHSLAAVGAHFERVDPRFLGIALVFHVANHLLRSLAWRNVLAAAYPQRRVALLPIAAAYAVGVALNAVLPGRGGDAAKIGLVRARIEGSALATIAATMSVVVLFDLLAATVLVLVVCLAGALPFAPRLAAPGWLTGHGPVAAAALAVGAIACVVVARRMRGPLRALRVQARQGGAILGTPGRYARRVGLVQAAAWLCRIAVVFLLLLAFGLHATLPLAALVMVLCGASTIVPLTPGGAGTQQVMLTYALGQAAGAALVLSFSVGMQVGITAVNALLGVAGAMFAFGTPRPLQALRAGLRLARAPAG